MSSSKIIVASLEPRWNLEGQALPFENLSLHLEPFIRAVGSKMSSQRDKHKSGVLWVDVYELATEWQRSQFKSVSFCQKQVLLWHPLVKRPGAIAKNDPQSCLLGQLVSGRKGQRGNFQSIGCNFQTLC